MQKYWQECVKRTYFKPQGMSGFTLVELMLAVTVVGVLVVIAMPLYADYRERIKRDTAIRDIKILQLLVSDVAISNGALPTSLADIGNGNYKDPWGNAYIYTNLTLPGGRGAARKDHKLNPINSEFDLYSKGKDGVSKTQLTQKDSLDDIVRARDGAYVGRAADFSQ
jgi:general secretion pathway protein G